VDLRVEVAVALERAITNVEVGKPKALMAAKN